MNVSARSSAGSSGPGSSDSPPVLLVVEQLRRDVPGGIGTYGRGLLRGIAPIGQDQSEGLLADVALLASKAPLGTHGAIADVDPLAAFGLPVFASRLPGPLLTRAWARGLAPAPRGFHVVHAISLAAPPVRARGAGNRPALVVTVHDLAWRHYPDATTPHGRRWHEAALARALRHADAFVVTSTPVLEDLCAAGADPGAVTVIDQGADHLPPADTWSTDRVLSTHGVRGEYLLAVGTLEPRKNLARLVAAYSAIRPALPEPWPLVVVGPRGWGGSAGRRGASARPWDDGLRAEGIVAIGAVSDAVLAGLYTRARTFAYVPLIEGFGLPPLEAMSVGVPVVASSGVPSVRTADGAEPIAAIVDPFDVDAIAAALLSASTDGARRDALVGAATANIEDRTWRRAATEHVKLWHAVAASRGRS
jgi:glycosyltransferase involved in cell wall biosynthesis